MTLPLRVILIFCASLFGLALIAGLLQTISGATAAAAPLPEEALTPTPLANQPEAVITSPEISFIDSPNPVCSLPRPGTGQCYLSWPYLYASASPNYMITMTVSIDDQYRARYQGFFQTSMYVPTGMLRFQVSCGAPGSGGEPDWGLRHQYTLRGRDSAGLTAANFGQVFCPADIVQIYLPLLKR